jgi:Na+/H+ antiporter NhaD/arsenite permease-like protein
MRMPLAPLAVQEALASTTDPVSQGLVAAILVGVFVLLAREAAHRVLVVLGAVAVLWLLTYFTPWRLISFEGTRDALDINVLVLLAAMMALVGVLKTTGVFEWAVAHLLRRAHGRPLAALTLVVWFTAALSAFLDNVTTVIFMTPMVIGLARQLRMSAAAILLPMVMASNIGGTATLIGDPPNIMIGSGANLSFIEFLRTLTLPCAVMVVWMLVFSRWRFRDALVASDDVVTASHHAAVPALTNPALARWMLVISAGVLVGFLTHHLTHMPAAVPATVGAAAALIVQDRLYLRDHRPTPAERMHGVLVVTERDIEWPTLAFFGFLFIIVGAAVETGLIGTLAVALQDGIAAGERAFGLSPQATLLFAALLICWASGLLSALIDNIPFVAVSIPIVAQLTGTLSGDTQVLWWALSLGACLGGNGTPIGASANVTTLGLAEKEGVPITFGDFTRFGAVVAAGTLVIASVFLALYVYVGRDSATLVSGAVFVVLALGMRLRSRLTRAAPMATG